MKDKRVKPSAKNRQPRALLGRASVPSSSTPQPSPARRGIPNPNSTQVSNNQGPVNAQDGQDISVDSADDREADEVNYTSDCIDQDSDDDGDKSDEDYEDPDSDEDMSEAEALYLEFQMQGQSDEHADDEVSDYLNPVEEEDEEDEEEEEKEEEDETTDEIVEDDEAYFRNFYDNNSDPDAGSGGSTTTGSSSSGSSSGNNHTSSSLRPRPSRYTSGLAGSGWYGTSWTRANVGNSANNTDVNALSSETGPVENDWYHPEHPVLRKRINDMYRTLAHAENISLRSTTTTAAGSPTTPSPASSSPALPHPSAPVESLSQALSLGDRSLTNVSDLADLLVRAHLPQFWRYRDKNKALNKHNNKPSNNSRPRKWTLLATCVDCGFKFRKSLIYDQPSVERQEDRVKREVNPGPPGSRTPMKDTKDTWAERIFMRLSWEYPDNNPEDDDQAHHGDDDRNPYLTYIRNSTLSPWDIDNIFNDNRWHPLYDGNLDKVAKNGRATKLPIGWDIAIGFDHSSIPTYPNPRPIAPPPPSPFSSTPASPSTTPPSTTAAVMDATAAMLLPHKYYPSRSLIPAFCHLLPRDMPLTQNQIRKLFVYFLWHPWFDYDFQAITLRRAYSELWPLFLLRDEDEEPNLDAPDSGRHRGKKSNMGNRNQGPGLKRKAMDESDDEGAGSGGNKRHQPNRPNQQQPSNPNSTTQPISPSTPQYLSEDQLYDAMRERVRQRQLEIRFTNSVERAMGNHGVICHSRSRTREEAARKDNQERRGWIFGPFFEQNYDDGYNANDDDQDDDDHHHHHHFPARRGTIHIYRANDPIQITKEDYENKTIFPPEVVYPEDEIPRFMHRELTQPNRRDALARLTNTVLRGWEQEAQERREQLGFVLPEFGRPQAEKKEKPKTRTRTSNRKKKTTIAPRKKSQTVHTTTTTTATTTTATEKPTKKMTTKGRGNARTTRCQVQEDRDTDMVDVNAIVPSQSTAPTTTVPLRAQGASAWTFGLTRQEQRAQGRAYDARMMNPNTTATTTSPTARIRSSRNPSVNLGSSTQVQQPQQQQQLLLQLRGVQEVEPPPVPATVAPDPMLNVTSEELFAILISTPMGQQLQGGEGGSKEFLSLPNAHPQPVVTPAPNVHPHPIVVPTPALALAPHSLSPQFSSAAAQVLAAIGGLAQQQQNSVLPQFSSFPPILGPGAGGGGGGSANETPQSPVQDLFGLRRMDAANLMLTDPTLTDAATEEYEHVRNNTLTEFDLKFEGDQDI
ncbi:hypothetical protein BGX33_001891 [Mortierella sp. NVP41]|nr:hypothetical protein BGX33_001891 [Mortierella sp. NVP41]